MDSPLRVVIAEDDATSAMALHRLLGQAGHTVMGTARSVAELFRLVERYRPDVVIADIWLEGQRNGVDATRELVCRLGAAVILVSGTTNAEVFTQVADSGALGFMKKPVTSEELRVNLQIVHGRQSLLHRLQESEARYRSFFDNAAVGIYRCDPQGGPLVVNAAYAKMLGYDSPQQFIALVRTLGAQVYEDPLRHEELMVCLRAEGAVRGFESQVYGRDGEMLWVSEHCTATIDPYGAMEGYEAIVVDITPRKIAEAHLQTTLKLLQCTMDALPDPVTLLDRQRNVIMCNEAFRLWEAATGRQNSCKAPEQLSPSGGPTPFERFLQDGERHSGRVCFVHSAERAESRVTPYCAPTGDVIGVVEVVRLHGAG